MRKPTILSLLLDLIPELPKLAGLDHHSIQLDIVGFVLSFTVSAACQLAVFVSRFLCFILVWNWTDGRRGERHVLSHQYTPMRLAPIGGRKLCTFVSAWSQGLLVTRCNKVKLLQAHVYLSWTRTVR